MNFLETHITGKYKDKLIILDNASSHRNDKIKELVNKNEQIGRADLQIISTKYYR